MKKLLIGATAMLVCVGVFAQGKLSFINNTDNLIYFTTNTKDLVAADASKTVAGFALAGSGLYTGAGSTIAALSGSPTIIAGLWAGTSSSSLSLQTTTTIDTFGNEGQVVSVNTILSGIPASSPAWFQVQVYDSRAGSGGAAAAWAAGQYGGESSIFQATPGPSVYNPVWNPSAPVLSTWAPGTATLIDYPGVTGGIVLYSAVVPEPGTFALAGLGLAALLVLRRRS